MIVLQISFRYDMDAERFAQENGPEIAAVVADVDGLRWKLWLHDPDARECVGVYHFADRGAAQAYLDGPLMTGFRQAPGYHDITPRIYEVLEENSRITRAPGLAFASTGTADG